ncbi:MAG: prolyl-tRNA synthetase associated domain-containing protein [Methyloceanibacter sp.]|uniref:prolyl-tRNA synthetase associated domain-containing protein n=1 Tax=Methyloceanibacter sp. TaxID=1965321 RepID=UPI003EE29AFD
MDSKRATLFARLEELGIASTTVEHAPMFTVEQSQSLRGTIPGAPTKNLFLKDKDGRLVLVVAKEDTKVDLKGLAKRLGFGRFSFGKPALLMEILGIEPGAVTAFALINENSQALAAVVVDEALLDFAEVNAHPLVNSATTRVVTDDLLKFVKACGHAPLILPLG